MSMRRPRRREAAVIGRAEMGGIDESCGLEHAIADLLGRLDARVDRVRDSDEDPAIPRRLRAQDLQDPRAILLARELDEEVLDLEPEERRQQLRVVHVGAVGRVLVSARAGRPRTGSSPRRTPNCRGPEPDRWRSSACAAHRRSRPASPSPESAGACRERRRRRGPRERRPRCARRRRPSSPR